MKLIYCLAIVLSIACVSQTALAQGNTAWSFGVRQHAFQPDFPDISFGDGDLSYGLAVEAGDAGGVWQAALFYTPEIDGIDNFDYALTPQINLVLTERAWRMGLGIAKTYMSSDAEKGWRDLYWQAILGLGFPVFGKLKLEAQAIYVFDKLGNIDQFDVDNLEYALWIGVPF